MHYGTVASMTVGYGAPATGTLTATEFFLNGVEYTVDRLTVVTNASAVAVVRFATTPDLPATARLRLAVPRFYTSPGLNRYLALEPASLVSGGTDVDYEWPWSGGRPNLLADETATFYLTRAPGRTGDVSGFWEATLTPNDRRPHPPDLVGYRGAGLSIPGFRWEDAGAGTLAPGTMSLGGVTYTVEVLAIVSDTDDYLDLSLRTDPLLPRGQDLWLELGHVDGSTAVFAIDTASVEAPGYRWRAVYAGEDRHRWGTDGSDADTDIDSVTVRLSTGAPTITGTAQVGETLTAVTTGITDADGLTSPTYTYQWIQVNGTAADIVDENSSTYTLVDADLGKAIKVKVSFTDDANNAETRTSAATATVTADTTTSVSGVLVSNVGQTSDNLQGFTDNDFAQSFTTGTDPTGYTLTSIELKLGLLGATGDTPTVKLYSGSAIGTEVSTFTGAASGASNGNNTFTPSSTVNLGMSTTYWVVAEGTSGVSWINTSSTSEDATPAAGWLIGDRFETRPASSTGSFTEQSATSLQIRVNGTLGSTTTTNAAPTVANPIDDQTATVGTALLYAFPANTFADTDASDTLTYTATQSDDTALPSWLSFAAATRTFSGTPADADVGTTVSVKVTASDGTLSVSDTFDIVVSTGTTTTCASPCLVSNVGQLATTDPLSFSSGASQYAIAQGFTTGANSLGYTLTSIEIAFKDALTATQVGDLTASVWSDDGSGNPSAELFTLTKPASIVAATTTDVGTDSDVTGNYAVFNATTATCSGNTGWTTENDCLGNGQTWNVVGTALGASTQYHLYLAGSSSKIYSTSSDVETGAPNWSIANAGNRKQTVPTSGNWMAHAGASILTRVNGTTVPNTPPTAANNTVTAGVGRTYTFTAGDFGFDDADTGATLASVKIVTVPTPGALALDGTAVVANAVVTRAQIDGYMLTFTPAAGASSTAGYASFTFKVNDGMDDSASTYTMTIDVAVLSAITIAADRDKATGKLDWIRYTLNREGDTAAALTVTVTFAGPAGNDWNLDPTGSAKRDVTFAADSATATQLIRVSTGFGLRYRLLRFGGHERDADRAARREDGLPHERHRRGAGGGGQRPGLGHQSGRGRLSLRRGQRRPGHRGGGDRRLRRHAGAVAGPVGQYRSLFHVHYRCRHGDR